MFTHASVFTVKDGGPSYFVCCAVGVDHTSNPHAVCTRHETHRWSVAQELTPEVYAARCQHLAERVAIALPVAQGHIVSSNDKPLRNGALQKGGDRGALLW